MKVIVEIDNHLETNTILIKCKEKNDLVSKVEKYIKDLDDIKLPFYQKNHEYYLNLKDILFFETEANNISAHTASNIYYVKYKLYELEKILPKKFVRVSKSAIVNVNQIYSINKKITSSSEIEFNKTYKKVFVSRFYFKSLKEKLKERS